jgi:hypothetical protein
VVQLSDDESALLEVLAVRARQHVQAAQRAGFRYSSIEHLVIAEGRWFEPNVALAGTPNAVTSYSGVAAWAVRSHLAYVEGYALTETGDVQSGAWCADANGNVVAGPPGAAYRGIPLTERFREESRRLSGSVSVLQAGGHHQQQLLRRGLPSYATLPVGRET